MSASLVGSEMCIRDSTTRTARAQSPTRHPVRGAPPPLPDPTQAPTGIGAAPTTGPPAGSG
eukprot:8367525-Alexandrium_andersonii.AAC.1